ncbi:hypothetical protein FIBSPDRAFT_900883 [Athelia psychrophila]|uniref:Uncharacterized protein n=1 Tax=Athelia psychrophila TaxID=1759441 RepID=A0A165XUD3_9AGAM|nr:hypothetical protein FIBSPDRAFT_900883 [Fibularhizoctonia sp. CBS 109695]
MHESGRFTIRTGSLGEGFLDVLEWEVGKTQTVPQTGPGEPTSPVDETDEDETGVKAETGVKEETPVPGEPEPFDEGPPPPPTGVESSENERSPSYNAPSPPHIAEAGCTSAHGHLRVRRGVGGLDVKVEVLGARVLAARVRVLLGVYSLGQPVTRHAGTSCEKRPRELGDRVGGVPLDASIRALRRGQLVAYSSTMRGGVTADDLRTNGNRSYMAAQVHEVTARGVADRVRRPRKALSVAGDPTLLANIRGPTITTEVTTRELEGVCRHEEELRRLLPVTKPVPQTHEGTVAVGVEAGLGVEPNVECFYATSGRARRGPAGTAGTMKWLPLFTRPSQPSAIPKKPILEPLLGVLPALVAERPLHRLRQKRMPYWFHTKRVRQSYEGGLSRKKRIRDNGHAYPNRDMMRGNMSACYHLGKARVQRKKVALLKKRRGQDRTLATASRLPGKEARTAWWTLNRFVHSSRGNRAIALLKKRRGQNRTLATASRLRVIARILSRDWNKRAHREVTVRELPLLWEGQVTLARICREHKRCWRQAPGGVEQGNF